ncbi:hypothetical protein ACFQJ7_17180 [Halovenus rubra]|uniref:Uncharacterized protein n=2 Tax=Halovenus rubra TaxID=869890 RepID=A0ABD5XDN9_9EURY|nr:hypothetical protein [Halovenus rubra]
MSRRFSIVYGEEKFTHDEVIDLSFERDEFINLGVKINPGQVARMGNIANQLGVDGDRLQWLLGTTKDEEPKSRGLVDIEGEDQDELLDLLVELKSELEDDLDLGQIEAELDTLSDLPRGEQIEAVGEYRYYGHRMYSMKITQLIDQIEFAKEYDFRHRII